MAEDYQLCTYEKHHKQKILLFLSSMRSHADSLKSDKFKLEYIKIEDKDFKDDYLKKLKKIISSKKISIITIIVVLLESFLSSMSMLSRGMIFNSSSLTNSLNVLTANPKTATVDFN